MSHQHSGSPPLLSCAELTGAYGLTVPLTLSLSHPELVGLIGPNGAGKSTLLRLLLGLDPPLTGFVRLCGQDPRRSSALERPKLLSYMPQSPPCSPHWTLRELISQGLAGLPSASQEERQALLMQTLDTLQLTSLAARRAGEVSGGELRRAFIGRALIQSAAVTLLDEPLAHLDWAQREGLISLIKRLGQAEGRLTIIALHDLNLASLYCDQLILLTPGAPPRFGRPSELITEYTLKGAYGRSPTLVEHPSGQGRALLPSGQPLDHAQASAD